MKNKRHNQPIADFFFAMSDLLESITSDSFVSADIKTASAKLAAWKTAPDEIKELFETYVRKAPAPNLHCVCQLLGKSFKELKRPFEVALSDDAWDWLKWNGYHD